jgi:hypothetical protein
MIRSTSGNNIAIGPSSAYSSSHRVIGEYFPLPATPIAAGTSGALTLRVATPVVIGQVAALVAKWVNRIQDFIRALLGSLRRLSGKLDELTGVLDKLKQELRRLSRTDPATDAPDVPSSLDFFSKSPVRSNRDVLDNGPGTPMTLDNVQDIADPIDIDLQDVDVVIISDPEEIRYLDHMRRASPPSAQRARRSGVRQRDTRPRPA